MPARERGGGGGGGDGGGGGGGVGASSSFDLTPRRLAFRDQQRINYLMLYS